MENDTNSSKGNESDGSTKLKENEAESQEKINQRREARRRKILDNAKTRLEKLGGRMNNYDNRNDAFFEYPDPEVEPNEIKFSTIKMNTASSTKAKQENAYDPFADEVPPKEYFAFKYRLHVLLSIAITHILTLMGFIGELNYFSVVVPTGLCVILELIIKPIRQVNPLVALAVSLCGLSPRLASIAWSLLSIAYDLVIDLGLSVFSIVTLTMIYSYLSGTKVATLQ